MGVDPTVSQCEIGSGSSRFQPGEGPSRGLLRAYEPSDGTFLSTTADRCSLPCSTAEAGAWQTAIVVLYCRPNGVIAAHCLHNDSNRF